jgi:formylmethanofuran dehydrogenase subunit D
MTEEIVLVKRVGRENTTLRFYIRQKEVEELGLKEGDFVVVKVKKLIP